MNTYVIHFNSTDGYRYTSVVQILKTGLPRKAEINRVAEWVRVNIPNVQRLTNITGPVDTYRVD